MKFLVVTGLSGAGKSMAANALEDIGFFCIDNIPAGLLPRIVDFALQGENQLNRVAVVMDIRGLRTVEEVKKRSGRIGRKRRWIMTSCSWMQPMQSSAVVTRRPAASIPWQ